MASTGDGEHGCILTAKWGWTDDVATSRWSNPQQCYKRQRVRVATADDDNNDGFPVVETKLKIRGSGKALTIRFESEDGKDFQLLGFAIPFTAEGTP